MHRAPSTKAAKAKDAIRVRAVAAAVHLLGL
jgi:hypothetical protein